MPAPVSTLMLSVTFWTVQQYAESSLVEVRPGSSVDRSGAQWLKLNATGGTLTYNTHGRVYDNSSTAPFYYYYFPSLMVNPTFDMLLGFSGSRGTLSGGTEYIGAFYTGLRASGTMLARPVLIQAGRGYYADLRWGDYSYTSLDPTDGLAFWTVQEYAELPTAPGAQIWGTWITKVKLNP